MKSKHDKHWRRTFCDLKRGKFSRRAIRHFVRRICALQSGRRLSDRLPAASSSGAVAGASAVKTNFGAVSIRSLEAWKREQTSGDEFVAFVHPTQEPDLRDLDGGLLTPEACSG